MPLGQLIDRKSHLWSYLDPDLQGLVSDGEELLRDVELHKKTITDYSYLVFPFSKAYEGFLKKFFLNLGLISKAAFYGDEIRIGRILNPTFKDKDSVFRQMNRHLSNKALSEQLWIVWKNARNLVFHYYPHNFRRLSYREAQLLIGDIIEAMGQAVNIV